MPLPWVDINTRKFTMERRMDIFSLDLSIFFFSENHCENAREERNEENRCIYPNPEQNMQYLITINSMKQWSCKSTCYSYNINIRSSTHGKLLVRSESKIPLWKAYCSSVSGSMVIHSFHPRWRSKRRNTYFIGVDSCAAIRKRVIEDHTLKRVVYIQKLSRKIRYYVP